ncbi:LPXTG cell wall anchor domain-containing protein [Marinicella gelatinilytica]|uniref:LPXTG cell wall anchor domain-containing protein n=1 Tax=Marinicella gelatinilytica TaxID=2996017 RepID=UPI0022609CA4|nr:LPXTG cell wall anchor domain-containing protein [Marinicella gelatinilytica]MCX7544563.1 LPXTG cell wall anchor domain-containing protein [Marinicella gelatinilytica]
MKVFYLVALVFCFTTLSSHAISAEDSVHSAETVLLNSFVANNETKSDYPVEKGIAGAMMYFFEAGEGFSPGFLGGQAGWLVLSGSTAQPIIDNSDPANGTQHMQLGQDSSLPAGTNIGGLSPDLGPQPAGNESRVFIDVKITAISGSSYTVFAQAPSTAQGTWNVSFDSTGNILVADNIGGGYVYIDSGMDWPVNTYFRLEVITNPGGLPGIDYYLNGNLFYSQVTMLFSDKVEQIAIYSDNNNSGEVANFDNLVIDNNYGSGGPTGPATPVPSLSVFGLILLSLALLLTVRRKFVH